MVRMTIQTTANVTTAAPTAAMTNWRMSSTKDRSCATGAGL
jgi:hypothetical protein